MDGIRMLDVMAITRGLKEFRSMDQEQRLQAHRLGVEAAIHEVQEEKKDVPKTEKASELNLKEEKHNKDDKHKKKGKHGENDVSQEHENHPPPECDEGRLLDIKA